jgi:hypothetical protein
MSNCIRNSFITINPNQMKLVRKQFRCQETIKFDRFCT